MGINGKQKSKKDDWQTPGWLFSQLNSRFGFHVDAAAISQNTKLVRFFDDGLSSSWAELRIFCNPPFSNKATWMEKAYDEVLHGGCPLCVMILPNCIDTVAFNQYVHGTFHWEHLPYRVSFLDDSGKPVSGNPSGTIIVYFWKRIKKCVLSA